MAKIWELGKKAKVGIIVATLLVATIATVWYLRQQSQLLQSQNQITITISPTQVITAPGNKTTFTVTVSGPTDQIAITYNDGTEPEIYRVNGNSGTTIQINHTFMAEGKYRVVVVAPSPLGTAQGKMSFPNASCEVISTNTPPSISFTVEGGTYNSDNRTVVVSEGTTLRLNATITDNVEYDLENMRILWRINGIISQSPNVTVQFNKSGVYPAYVVAMDPWGAIDYEYFFIVVRNHPPVARFTVDYDSGTGWMVIDTGTNTIYASEDTLLIFNATPSMDDETDLGRLRYIWIFGDDTLGEGAVVNHTYTKNGTYDVTLVVIDPENARSCAHVTVVVRNEPPEAEIVGPTVLYEGQTYIFEAEVNDTPTDLALLRYVWDYGEGGWFQTYTPLDDGLYTINLTVIDDDGLSNSTYLDTIVYNLPPEVYVSFKVWANIHLNITGEGWSKVLVSIIRDGIIEQNMTISWNKTIGNESYYANILYTFYITSDYELNITPIFANTSEDPWVDIQVWFTFGNTSSVPMEAMIYHIDGMPYYTASEREGVFKVCYENGTWTLWINPEDVADVAPLAIILNAWDPGMDNISVLLEYYENGTLVASRWVNIANNGTWPTWGTNQWNIIVSENATLVIHAWDSDGAYAVREINIYKVGRKGWDVIPEHVPPLLIVEAPNETVEDLPTIISMYMINGERGEYTITIDFGDGTTETMKTNSTSINVTHIYNYSGKYLIRIIAEHNGTIATWFTVVIVTNRAPEVYVPGYVNATEGIMFSVVATAADTEEDLNKTIIGWIINGKPYVGAVLNYTYPDSGAYNITVIVRDDEGAIDTKNITVYVEEREPRFASPEKFVADEGNPATLYIWIEDSPLDVLESNIVVIFEDSFDWLNSTFIVFDYLPNVNMSDNEVKIYNTTEITFWLDDGEYLLRVIVNNGEKTFNKTINVTINDMKPVILSSVYSYVQPATETEKITITLYAHDIYVDMHELNFTIEIPELGYTASIDPIKPSATFQIPMSIVTKSKEYIIKATVTDEIYQDKKEIKVRAYIDNNNDGAPDEYGLLHILPDDDGDYLPTALENASATWSDPNNPDTDGDGILDGIEYFGWQTEITTRAGRETIWVVSYPNDTDSDDDGLDDLYEKQLGTNPLSDDTDMDGLPDPIEVELNTTPTNWDTDNDGLSDGEEVDIYCTDSLSTDTDVDGLTDYDEIYKYKTSPIDNDTDDDGLGDAEEHISLTYSLDQKYNFTGTKTFEIYVPVEYSLSTTITIGLSDVEQNTEVKVWVYYSGRRVKYIEDKPQAPGVWTKAINITRKYVKGTWKLKIKVSEYVLLDKFQISITTRTDPTKYDTDGDKLGDGEEVKGIDIGGIRIWTNPLLRDTDMDGLSDSHELGKGTNPLSKDTDADGIIDSQDRAPKGNRLLEIRIGEVGVELYKEYVWRYLFGESWGSERWTEDTMFCVIIDTPYNAFILPYLFGNGEADYQNNPETKAYYVDIPDNLESTTIRLALYVKSWSTTSWLWWHKALEKRVRLSSNWATLEEGREVRHINLGFYEEWLRTEAQLEYMAKTYTQTFTKIYMVTKQDFVVKPDTEYVVLIMRVDGEFRTIVCPREVFLETRLGDIIMGMREDELESLGLGDANISGFSKGRISPYIYGLITKSDATSTVWSRVVAAITQNASGAEIASMVRIDRLLLPKDIVKMIPLRVPPQQGRSLPEYMSPEASIWAVIVGFATEAGRLLCGLFVALANFLAKFLRTIVEWGLKLLGELSQVLDAAKYLFAMALCVWSWVDAAFCALIILGVSLLFNLLGISVESSMSGFSIEFSLNGIVAEVGVWISSIDYYGFPIACLGVVVNISLMLFSEIYRFVIYELEPFILFGFLTEVMFYVSDTYRTTGTSAGSQAEYSPLNIIRQYLLFSMILEVFRDPLISSVIDYGSLGIIVASVIATNLAAGRVKLPGGPNPPLGLSIYIATLATIWCTLFFVSPERVCNDEFIRASPSAINMIASLARAIIFGWMVLKFFFILRYFRDPDVVKKREVRRDIIAFMIAMIVDLVAKWLNIDVASIIIRILTREIEKYLVAVWIGKIIIEYFRKLRRFVWWGPRQRAFKIFIWAPFIISIATFFANIVCALNAIADLGLPSISIQNTQLSIEDDEVASVSSTITVTDNKQLHFITVDLATNGGGYNPTHSKLDERGIKSRVMAESLELLVHLFEIERCSDGTLAITLVNNTTTLEGDDTVQLTYKTSDTEKLTAIISRTGETITITISGKIQVEGLSGGTNLHIVVWACDWIDNEAVSIAPGRSLASSQSVNKLEMVGVTYMRLIKCDNRLTYVQHRLISTLTPKQVIIQICLNLKVQVWSSMLYPREIMAYTPYVFFGNDVL